MTRTVSRPQRPRFGFTLVELLVVIVIIGILAALITAAVIMARTRAKEAAIRIEMSQLQMALEAYKNDVGEYPPDFWGINSSNTDIQTAARNEVSRHILKRFPQYVYSGTPFDQFVADMAETVAKKGYAIDVTTFDPATALAFWLGGLPDGESGDNVPAGFSQDPQHPFRRGLPRTPSHFQGFKSAQFVWVEEDPADSANPRYMRFYPTRTKAPSLSVDSDSDGIPDTNDNSPYVYFKARRVGTRYEYGYADAASPSMIVPAFYRHGSNGAQDVAVPYLEPGQAPYWADSNAGHPAPSTQPDYTDKTQLRHLSYIRRWRDREKYQLLCAGLDGQYGSLSDGSNLWNDPDRYRFRFTKTGVNLSADGSDLDNLGSFSEKSIEGEMK